jgi:hypothetical protein
MRNVENFDESFIDQLIQFFAKHGLVPSRRNRPLPPPSSHLTTTTTVAVVTRSTPLRLGCDISHLSSVTDDD